MYEYTEEIKVYGTSPSDWLGPKGTITGTGTFTNLTDPWNGLITINDVWTWFENNRYSSKPNEDYTTAGHGKLVGNDLSAHLKIQTWPDAETMKNAVLTDLYISTINAHAVNADYYLTTDNALRIKIYFKTEADRNNWLNTIKDRSPATNWFKDPGVVITTI